MSKKSRISLPDCIIEEEIFSRLPVKTLMRFKSLSKQWHAAISGAQFARLHQKHYQTSDRDQKSLLIDTRGSIQIIDWALFDDNKESLRLFHGPVNTGFDPKSVQFVGSCQGLVCSYHGMDYYFVWNPSTKNSRKISGCSLTRRDVMTGVIDIAMTLRGFGYVASIDDYKIVEIQVLTLSTRTTFKISVFKLKGGDWEGTSHTTDDDFYGLRSGHTCYVRPGTALVNETLHWLVSIEDSSSILAFDLADDKLQHHLIELPNSLSARFGAFLSVVKQRLCFCAKDQRFLQMWILRDFGWQKLYKIYLDTNFVGGKKFSELNLFRSSLTDALKILVHPCEGRNHVVVDSSEYRPKQMLLPDKLYLAYAVSYIETLVCP